MENKQVTFSYSASENEEIRKIRQKYEPKSEKEPTLEKVKKLDKSVYDIATAVSLGVGSTGTLIFGTGLSLILLYENRHFITGIIIGLIGILIAIAAYPVNQLVIYIKRKKIAPIILELTKKYTDKNK